MATVGIFAPMKATTSDVCRCQTATLAGAPAALDEVESTEARWVRINGGLEWLASLAQKEPNPIRREAIYNVLAEAHCLS